MLAVFMCITLLALTPTVVAMPVTNAIDGSSSIAGPIFRTQPAPRPASSSFGDYIAVTETDLEPQPTLCHSNDQTTVCETDATKEPAGSNETSENTDAYAYYCDQDGENVEDDYIPFFCCIPIILLIMLILLGTLNLQSFNPKMKKDSLESIICSQTNNSRCNMMQD